MKPFRSPLLKRPNLDEKDGCRPKKVHLGPVGAGPRLIFKNPGVSPVPRKPFAEVNNTSAELNAGDARRYYKVLWRQVTKKKNKTWEGDALLYVDGDGSAELHDSETGRSIGKAKCQEPLLPGSNLLVSGKDVEVENILSRDQYLTREQSPAAKKGRSTGSAKTQLAIETRPVPSRMKPEVTYSIRPQLKLKPLSKTSHSTAAIRVEGPPAGDETHEPAITELPGGSCPPERPRITSSSGRFKLQAPFSAKSTVQRPTVSAPNQGPEALVMKRSPNAKADVVVDPLLSKKLREHQSEGVRFLYECVMGLRDFNGQGSILADEMGLGKTLQTITLLWTLLRQSPSGDSSVIKKALIVCPATLINNWRKEFRKWLGDRIGVLVADNKTRVSHFTHGKSYSVMIVGYEKLRTIQEDLAKGQGVDLIVADEAHRLKTAKNKSAQAIKAFPTAMRIFLTGTPLQNDLSEFYMLIETVNPGVLGSLKSFTRDFEIPINRGRQPEASPEDVEQGEACSKELVKLTSPFILRRTVDVLARYLPAKTEHILFCRPTQAQAAVYRHVLASPAFHAAALGSCECPLQLITVLKKVCNSPSLLSSKAEQANTSDTATLVASVPPNLLRSNAGSTKLRMLDQLLHALRTTTSEKVVLVSNYTSTLDLLSNLLTSVGHNFTRVDGSTPSHKRQEIIDDFNRSSADDCFAFLLSARTGGVGINLIGASRLVLFDVDWNPATDLQAMARIHRDGQKRPCFIYRFLMAGGIDEKIWQRQIVKLGLASNIMDQKAESSSFTREDLKDLFRLDEGLSCQTHDLISCRCEGCNAACLDVEREADAEAVLPSIPALVQASAMTKEEQTKVAGAVSEAAHDTLMAYTHIDTSDFASGCNGDKEALIKDEVLLKTLKDGDNKISFVFSKTYA
ncbi:MAG: hypothetical protein Q9179_001680 [Wetmoreana sp. 5 TL-2023]